MKLFLAALSATFLCLGCASSSHQHTGAGMPCAMCSCKMAEADPAHPEKCKMCGHMMFDHTSGATNEVQTPHH